MSYPNYRPSEQKYIYSRKFGYFNKEVMSQTLIDFLNDLIITRDIHCIEYIEVTRFGYDVALYYDFSKTFFGCKSESALIYDIENYIATYVTN